MAKSKYKPLTNYLKTMGYSEIPMSFEEIEAIVGENLPASAFKHRPWWSNNPSNSVITYAWLAAGYKTASVDMERRRLIFRKTADAAQAVADKRAATAQSGLEEKAGSYEDRPRQRNPLDALYGCMKGTIKFAKDFDPCEPAWTEEDDRAFDQKWDRIFGASKTEQRA